MEVYVADAGEVFCKLSAIAALETEQSRREVAGTLNKLGFTGPNLEPTARGFYEQDGSKVLTRVMRKPILGGLEVVVELSAGLFTPHPLAYLVGEEASRKGVDYLMVYGPVIELLQQLGALAQVQTPAHLRELNFRFESLREYNP